MLLMGLVALSLFASANASLAKTCKGKYNKQVTLGNSAAGYRSTSQYSSADPLPASSAAPSESSFSLVAAKKNLASSSYKAASAEETQSEGAEVPTTTGTVTDGNTQSSTVGTSSTIQSLESTTSNGGLKRGVAWSSKPSSKVADVTAEKLKTAAGWYYTWGESPVDNMPDSVEFVPTIWSADETKVKETVEALLKQDTLPSYVLGPNECDLESQCNASPEDTAKIYTQYMSQLRAKGVKISSPPIAFNLTWLDNFFDTCGSDCPVDFLSVHHYMAYQKGFSDFQQFLQKYQDNWPDLDMWITEWAITKESDTSAADIASFLNETTAWFEKQDWVTRYSWFVTGSLVDDSYVDDNCALLDTDGVLTDLGQSYYA